MLFFVFFCRQGGKKASDSFTVCLTLLFFALFVELCSRDVATPTGIMALNYTKHYPTCTRIAISFKSRMVDSKKIPVLANKDKCEDLEASKKHALCIKHYNSIIRRCCCDTVHSLYSYQVYMNAGCVGGEAPWSIGFTPGLQYHSITQSLQLTAPS